MVKISLTDMHVFMGRFAKNPLALTILSLLRRRPMTGIEVIEEIEAMTLGFWRPSPGAVYPTLKLLERNGLVRHENRGWQKVYYLTDKGRMELEKICLPAQPETIDEVLNIIEGYVEYIKESGLALRVPSEARERIKSLVEEMLKIASAPG
jgi:DNA-binding PadR family transcriptional regulator